MVAKGNLLWAYSKPSGTGPRARPVLFDAAREPTHPPCRLRDASLIEANEAGARYAASVISEWRHCMMRGPAMPLKWPECGTPRRLDVLKSPRTASAVCRPCPPQTTRTHPLNSARGWPRASAKALCTDGVEAAPAGGAGMAWWVGGYICACPGGDVKTERKDPPTTINSLQWATRRRTSSRSPLSARAYRPSRPLPRPPHPLLAL